MAASLNRRTTSPFFYDKPVSDPNRLVGRQEQVQDIFAHLKNPDFRGCVITGDRGSGRTSLLNHINLPETSRVNGLDPESTLFVLIDLGSISSDDYPTGLFRRLVGRLAGDTRDAEVQKVLANLNQRSEIGTGEISNFLETLYQRNLQLVLLLDELQTLAAEDQPGIEFLHDLRSLANHPSLSLICSTGSSWPESAEPEAVKWTPSSGQR